MNKLKLYPSDKIKYNIAHDVITVLCRSQTMVNQSPPPGWLRHKNNNPS